jgi:hypothetical protein
MADGYRPKRLFRFSIGMMLFVVLCACGYFGGYRRGYESGVRQQFDDTICVISYDIDDLHREDLSAEGMERTADEMVALIGTVVTPDGWSHPYVLDGIEISPNYAKLKITNYGRIHRQIEDVLTQVRKLRQ